MSLAYFYFYFFPYSPCLHFKCVANRPICLCILARAFRITFWLMCQNTSVICHIYDIGFFTFLATHERKRHCECLLKRIYWCKHIYIRFYSAKSSVKPIKKYVYFYYYFFSYSLLHFKYSYTRFTYSSRA